MNRRMGFWVVVAVVTGFQLGFLHGQSIAQENREEAGQAASFVGPGGKTLLPSAVSGTVTDHVTGAPLAEISIRLRRFNFDAAGTDVWNHDFDVPRDIRTNDLGQFKVGGLLPGIYHISLKEAGIYIGNRMEDERDITLPPGSEATTDFQLRRGASAVILVTDETGSPVGDAQVSSNYYPSNGMPYRHEAFSATATGREGQYQFAGLPPGRHPVMVRKNGLLMPIEREFQIDSFDDSPVLEVAMSHGDRLKGTVLDEEGVPIEGAVVSSGDGLWLKTGSDGRIDATGLAPEASPAVKEYGRSVSISAPGYYYKTFDLDDLSDPTVFVLQKRKSLEESDVTLAGRVVNDLGEPVVDAAVCDVLANAYSQPTSEDGRFALPWDGKGLAKVFVESDTGLSPSYGMPIEDGNVIVNRYARVEGTVTSRDTGALIPVFVVEVQSNFVVYRGTWSTFGTGLSGVYAVCAAPNAAITVTASAPGFQNSKPIAFETVPGQMIKDIDFKLVPAGSLSGVVRDAETGEPVVEAIVYALRDAEDLYMRDFYLPLVKERAVTDGTGAYRFESVPYAQSDLFVLHTAHPPLIQEDVAVQSAVKTEQNIALKAGATLRGQIQLGGIPIPGVRVSAVTGKEPDEYARRWTVTDGQGKFILQGLVPGEIRLFARRESPATTWKHTATLGEGEEAVVEFEPRDGR